jgi:hypothetical protein
LFNKNHVHVQTAVKGLEKLGRFQEKQKEKIGKILDAYLLV